MLTKAIVFAVGCSALTFGCGADQAGDDTQEITDNLLQAGYPASEIRIADGVVYAGGDAVVTLEASREMISDDAVGEEQFRTNNLVSRTLTNICINGSTFTGVFSDALNRAITNYNNEGLTFR